MAKDQDIELIPNENKRGTRVFSSDADYEKFRLSFYEEVKASLDKWDEIRMRSEEEARQRWSR